MTSRDFCFWLQGLFELSPERKTLNAIQVEQIKNHLNLVFKHEIDPNMGDEKEQSKLSKIHTPKKEPPGQQWQPISGLTPDSLTLIRC